MTKNDFLYILADAIQQHEGWTIGSRSVINNNPGNIKDVGQAHVIGHDQGNFAQCKTFIDGKLLQVNDLSIKLAKHNTIRDIIATYAPAFENNTEAYIKSVVMFFNKRNVPVTDVMPIQDILNLPLRIGLLAIDQLTTPEQWASVQNSIQILASYMPAWSFATRYVNRPILDGDFYANPSPIGSLYALNETVVRSLLAPLNEGQKLNVLYFLYVNNTPKKDAGGVQYGGEAISLQQPETAFCNAAYQGSVPEFVEYGAREIYHEFIHCLFTLTGLPDNLHAYLVAHGGYAQNLLADLNAVYADIFTKYEQGTRVVEVVKQAVAIASADKNPADRNLLSQLLAAISALKGWWNK